MNPEIQKEIKEQINENPIIIYMKGTRAMPQCGFSAKVVQVLDSLEVPYATVDILEDEGIRQGIKEYSNWPTIPQLYIKGEFIGGCDIVTELYESGELQNLVSGTK